MSEDARTDLLARPWPVLVLVLLSVALSFIGIGTALEGAAPERARHVVSTLARLGGLQGTDGEVGRPLRVSVNQEGGPLWVTPAVEAAAQAHPAFEVVDDGLGVIRVEVLADDAHLALRGGLYRQGWNLRTEHPLRIRVLPWIGVLSLGLGLGLAYLTRRLGWGLLASGLLAQGFASSVGWPADVPAVDWSQAVRDGPLGRAVIELALSLPDSAVAIGAGIVTLCLVLVGFDHRRSAGRGGTLLVAGTLGAAGLVAWGEAAARVGMIAWMGTGAGVASILAMALAWGLGRRTLRRA
ncbi:MAG: hypothetical protein AAGA54_03210 [Myxococcota bacterium]